MCKSTQVPIQATKAEVKVDEDNSTSFLNIHMPTMTNVGGLVLIIFVVVALWRFWAHMKERRRRKLQLREMELTSISRSVHNRTEGGARRMVTAGGEDLTVTVVPTPRGSSMVIDGPSKF